MQIEKRKKNFYQEDESTNEGNCIDDEQQNFGHTDVLTKEKICWRQKLEHKKITR